MLSSPQDTEFGLPFHEQTHYEPFTATPMFSISASSPCNDTRIDEAAEGMRRIEEGQEQSLEVRDALCQDMSNVPPAGLDLLNNAVTTTLGHLHVLARHRLWLLLWLPYNDGSSIGVAGCCISIDSKASPTTAEFQLDQQHFRSTNLDNQSDSQPFRFVAVSAPELAFKMQQPA
ncbi:hypothetical protein BU25DRAFT_451595 [Macroventuria anomochaeta]|uniref:Uncharacterized protein n=1 Tax=Macroventuria anomochaeta TaxID=301207 RepID=A0ACB6RN66_9PLEO|nr:uncharacterized protein BU25DRAFT_451595 [Macroventuria anomochaeta]KAF2623173.1 hypothetical protein BU25DRAFT_451595 [Macroventuria anomochaeta]